METPVDQQQPPMRASLAAWWTAILLVALYTISFVDRFMVGLFVGPIKQTFHITDFQFSLMQGMAFALFYCLFGLPIGWAVDRYSKRMVIFCGLVVWSLAASATGLATSYWQMLAARARTGSSGSGSRPVRAASEVRSRRMRSAMRPPPRPTGIPSSTTSSYSSASSQDSTRTAVRTPSRDPALAVDRGGSAYTGARVAAGATPTPPDAATPAPTTDASASAGAAPR